jgi:L-arabinose transport system ATP-binding protein
VVGVAARDEQPSERSPRAKARGRTVIVVSSDLAEVIGVADRVIVMKEGCIVGNLPKAQATPDALIKLALPR